ncbi:hypothetical protein CC2G_001545 [Coprinopsis cinerea AmutBmut pab1-1]|nr:hypothetical protein CC2G_001545 [Coprinopsis cinerea AmutBmut pab1-1]
MLLATSDTELFDNVIKLGASQSRLPNKGKSVLKDSELHLTQLDGDSLLTVGAHFAWSPNFAQHKRRALAAGLSLLAAIFSPLGDYEGTCTPAGPYCPT